MDQLRQETLIETMKLINKLKVLVNFFKTDLLKDVLSKIQTVYTIFENNQELNSNKLNSFNLQYVQSLIALLSELKIDSERKILILDEDISKQSDLVKSIDDKANCMSDEIKQIDVDVKITLKNLYLFLSNQKDSLTLQINSLNRFHNMHKTDFFELVSESNYMKFSFVDEKLFYINPKVAINKRLLGILNKNEFKVQYVFGYLFGLSFVDIFKCAEIYFCYIQESNIFNIVDIEIPQDKITVSKFKEQSKLVLLKNRREMLKTITSEQILETLQNLSDKLSERDFLSDLQRIDAKTAVLNEMVRTEMLN